MDLPSVFIVFTHDNRIHSAWSTQSDADKVRDRLYVGRSSRASAYVIEVAVDDEDRMVED